MTQPQSHESKGLPIVLDDSIGPGLTDGMYYMARSYESRLPDVVGLCPRHFLEFYVPHDGICPYGDCGEQLVIYRNSHAL